MRHLIVALLFLTQAPPAPPPSAWLDLQTPPIAESLLKPETVVVIPLGSGLSNHGRHMPLGTDFFLADRLARDIMPATPVVVVPTVTYHLSPGPTQGPGTTTLTMETARDQTIEMVRELARAGTRRFYVLNTSEGSTRALRNAAATLAGEGILLRYSDLTPLIGKHGEEAETSALLHIEPKWVAMDAAEGEAARATAARGKTVLEIVTATIVQEIEALRKVSPPMPQRAAGPSRPNIRLPNVAGGRGVSGCHEGDERAIRQVADFFNLRWAEKDPEKVAGFWSKEGDLVHPDGAAEHGRETIHVNRREQFMRKEYSASKHTITFGGIRCISDDVAVVDGKWELSDVFDRAGNRLPRGDGLLTVVMKKQGGWSFEAYRYTVNQEAVRPPTLLKKPGYPDR